MKVKIISTWLLTGVIVFGQSFTFNDLPWLAGASSGPCTQSVDQQTSYTEGTNVNGENDGTCWTGAYVASLF